jgi:hypothetical protein
LRGQDRSKHKVIDIGRPLLGDRADVEATTVHEAFTG